MKINWAVRFKNKSFLITFIPFVASFIYQLLGTFGVVPKMAESDVVNTILQIVNLLAVVGIINDGTTKGLSDSEKALTYEKPAE